MTIGTTFRSGDNWYGLKIRSKIILQNCENQHQFWTYGWKFEMFMKFWKTYLSPMTSNLLLFYNVSRLLCHITKSVNVFWANASASAIWMLFLENFQYKDQKVPLRKTRRRNSWTYEYLSDMFLSHILFVVLIWCSLILSPRVISFDSVLTWCFKRNLWRLWVVLGKTHWYPHLWYQILIVRKRSRILHRKTFIWVKCGNIINFHVIIILIIEIGFCLISSGSRAGFSPSSDQFKGISRRTIISSKLELSL